MGSGAERPSWRWPEPVATARQELLRSVHNPLPDRRFWRWSPVGSGCADQIDRQPGGGRDGRRRGVGGSGGGAECRAGAPAVRRRARDPPRAGASAVWSSSWSSMSPRRCGSVSSPPSPGCATPSGSSRTCRAPWPDCRPTGCWSGRPRSRRTRPGNAPSRSPPRSSAGSWPWPWRPARLHRQPAASAGQSSDAGGRGRARRDRHRRTRTVRAPGPSRHAGHPHPGCPPPHRRRQRFHPTPGHRCTARRATRTQGRISSWALVSSLVLGLASGSGSGYRTP